MKKRILWIDLLRITGIIGVMLMHIVGNTKNTFGNLQEQANNIYSFICIIAEYAVPLFIMISGAMFLRKGIISYKEMFNKYIKKIIISLIFFGTIMIIIEEFYTTKTINTSIIKTIIIKLLTGDLWAHMWYLYLIIGLYLITPVLTRITNNIEKKEFTIFLTILFILTIILNTINNYLNIIIIFNSISISGYIFYYFYGYYLYKYDISKKYKIITYLLSFLSFICILFIVKNKPDTLLEYTSFIPFIISSSIFISLKNNQFNKCTKLITSIGTHSYGIYIIHQFYINIIYKFIKLKYIIYHPYIGIILYFIVIFTCSYLTIFILKKFKIIDKYLL